MFSMHFSHNSQKADLSDSFLLLFWNLCFLLDAVLNYTLLHLSSIIFFAGSVLTLKKGAIINYCQRHKKVYLRCGLCIKTMTKSDCSDLSNYHPIAVLSGLLRLEIILRKQFLGSPSTFYFLSDRQYGLHWAYYWSSVDHFGETYACAFNNPIAFLLSPARTFNFHYISLHSHLYVPGRYTYDKRPPTLVHVCTPKPVSSGVQQGSVTPPTLHSLPIVNYNNVFRTKGRIHSYSNSWNSLSITTQTHPS